MSVADFAVDALMWIERVIKVLPAFQALWQAVEADNQGQVFAAQMELTRSIRREQTKAEIEELPPTVPEGDQS